MSASYKLDILSHYVCQILAPIQISANQVTATTNQSHNRESESPKSAQQLPREVYQLLKPSYGQTPMKQW
jgi:hypothetical protein